MKLHGKATGSLLVDQRYHSPTRGSKMLQNTFMILYIIILCCRMTLTT